MKFSINITFDYIHLKKGNGDRKSAIVVELETEIKKFLENKDYGNTIQEYIIILYIVNFPNGENERFFKDYKPKYIDYKVTKNAITGEPYEFVKHFRYSVKLDGDLYTRYTESSDEESKKLLASELFKSFSCLDKLPRKIKDFDVARFRADMEGLFKEHNLID
jgi:hypothetical protein